jgi:hypothetical protein
MSFGQKSHLTAFSCGLLMIITQEPAQSLAALDAPHRGHGSEKIARRCPFLGGCAATQGPP